MARRLLCAKPLSKPMLGYHQLDPLEQTSVKFQWEFYHFHSRKCIWICRLLKRRTFSHGEDEFNQNSTTSINFNIIIYDRHEQPWLPTHRRVDVRLSTPACLHMCTLKQTLYLLDTYRLSVWRKCLHLSRSTYTIYNWVVYIAWKRDPFS